MQQCENNIVLDTADRDIVLNHRIKTRDGWVAVVEIIHERTSKRAHALKEQPIPHSKQTGVLMAKSSKDVNKLHIELAHLLKVTMWAMGKDMGSQDFDTFKTCKDGAFEKGVCKKNSYSMIKC